MTLRNGRGRKLRKSKRYVWVSVSRDLGSVEVSDIDLRRFWLTCHRQHPSRRLNLLRKLICASLKSCKTWRLTFDGVSTLNTLPYLFRNRSAFPPESRIFVKRDQDHEPAQSWTFASEGLNRVQTILQNSSTHKYHSHNTETS